MKRRVIVLLAVALTGFASVAGAEMKIGYVNTDALMQASPQAMAAQQALSAEFTPRGVELQGLDQALKARQAILQQNAATMTDLQRSQADKELRDKTRDLQQKQQQFDDDVNARRDEETQKVQRALRDEIGIYGKANGFDFILSAGVIYAAPAADMTTAILESLKKKAGVATTPAAAPAAPAAKAPATTPPAAKPPAKAPAKD